MNDNTPWTSIDLYYKGVHVKKSIPDNIKAEKVIEVIDHYLSLGFKPSWNEDTNKAQTKKPYKDVMEGQKCEKCGADLILSKKGNWYCSEKCWLKNQ